MNTRQRGALEGGGWEWGGGSGATDCFSVCHMVSLAWEACSPSVPASSAHRGANPAWEAGQQTGPQTVQYWASGMEGLPHPQRSASSPPHTHVSTPRGQDGGPDAQLHQAPHGTGKPASQDCRARAWWCQKNHHGFQWHWSSRYIRRRLKSPNSYHGRTQLSCGFIWRFWKRKMLIFILFLNME